MSDKRDTNAIAEDCRDGKFNGQIATERGPKTVPNKNHSSLDASQQGSKAGVLKKSK